jgi:hypothetical protein
MAKKPNPKGRKPRASDGAKRGPKPKPKATEAAAPKKPTPKIFNSEIDAEEKALFLRHRPLIEAQLKKVNTAVSDLRKLYKTAKAEGGFTKADFDFARQLETAEAEEKARAKIARNFKIAKIVGSDIGAQLDMFEQPSRIPAVDRAAEEGQRASMEGKTAAPKYDPSTPQYRAYMDAYHADQEQRIKDGIKPTEAAQEVADDEKKKSETKLITKAQKEADAKAFEEAEAKKNSPPKSVPQSGVPMTRSEFNAKRAQAREEAESMFRRKGEAVN